MKGKRKFILGLLSIVAFTVVMLALKANDPFDIGLGLALVAVPGAFAYAFEHKYQPEQGGIKGKRKFWLSVAAIVAFVLVKLWVPEISGTNLGLALGGLISPEMLSYIAEYKGGKGK